MMQINKTWKTNLPLYSISFQNELSFQMLWSPEACAASWVASTLPAPSSSLGMYPLLDLSLGSAPLQRTCALSGVFPCACRIWNLLPVLPTVHLTQTATARKKSRGSPSAVPSHPFKQSKKKKKPNNNKIETKPSRKKKLVLSSVRQKSRQNWRQSVVPPSKLQILSWLFDSDVHLLFSYLR